MLVAGDVLGDVRAGSPGVAHLAEDAAARAGDAFDGFERFSLNGVRPHYAKPISALKKYFRVGK